MLNGNLKKHYYLGGIHIHSKFSDGSGDINEISLAAKKAELKWIIMTDHNNFDIEEGIFNDVYVIKGEEISPNDDNHYLALGINKYIEPSFNAQENVINVRDACGFGFAAHPDEGFNKNNKTRKNKFRAINWLDKNIEPDGIEIWNWFSQWGDNLNDSNIFTLIYAYLFKNKLITEPSSKTLQWWDDLNNKYEKIIPAIGGVDAHAMKISNYIIPVTIFPYKQMFKTITNVAILHDTLSKDFETAKKQILAALKNGNNIILNRNISTDIPEIYINNENATAYAGEHIKLTQNTKLNIDLATKNLIKIFHNGLEIKNTYGKNINMNLHQTGKYRVEIKSKNKGFLYSNPIIVY